MIKVKSQEWTDFINKLEVIKTKSNREVLCIHCWQMLNCKQKLKHLKRNSDHEKYLLTSTKYASEKQILSLAQTQNKFYRMQDGDYIMPPYGPLNRVNKMNVPGSLMLGDQYIKTLLSNDNLFNQPSDHVSGGNMAHQESSLNFQNMNPSLGQQHLMMQQDSGLIQTQNSSVDDKIALINQKLDSVIKVLQMLIQQDLNITQNLNTLTQNFQNFVQTQLKPNQILSAPSQSMPHLSLNPNMQGGSALPQQNNANISGSQQAQQPSTNSQSLIGQNINTQTTSNNLIFQGPQNLGNISSIFPNQMQNSALQGFQNTFGNFLDPEKSSGSGPTASDVNPQATSAQYQTASLIDKNFKPTMNTVNSNNPQGSQSLGGSIINGGDTVQQAFGNHFQLSQNQTSQSIGQQQNQLGLPTLTSNLNNINSINQSATLNNIHINSIPTQQNNNNCYNQPQGQFNTLPQLTQNNLFNKCQLQSQPQQGSAINSASSLTPQLQGNNLVPPQSQNNNIVTNPNLKQTTIQNSSNQASSFTNPNMSGLGGMNLHNFSFGNQSTPGVTIPMTASLNQSQNLQTPNSNTQNRGQVSGGGITASQNNILGFSAIGNYQINNNNVGQLQNQQNEQSSSQSSHNIQNASNQIVATPPSTDFGINCLNNLRTQSQMKGLSSGALENESISNLSQPNLANGIPQLNPANICNNYSQFSQQLLQIQQQQQQNQILSQNPLYGLPNPQLMNNQSHNTGMGMCQNGVKTKLEQ